MAWGLAKRNESAAPLDKFRKEMDRVFDDFFSLTPSTLFESSWLPKVDVDEDDKSVHVIADLPGIDEKNLDITLNRNMLTIAGEKQEHRETRDERRNSVISERSYGSFSRTIALPGGIKTDQVNAEFHNGVLKIVIPKEETAQSRKIEIKAK